MSPSSLLLLPTLVLLLGCTSEARDLAEIARKVNSRRNVAWTADARGYPDHDFSVFDAVDDDDTVFMGNWGDDPNMLRVKTLDVDEFDALPENFDAREQWPACISVIGHVRDQSRCGSCWAFAATTAFNDRLCIKTDGEDKALLSPTHVMACCPYCGNGCRGGSPGAAWNFFVTQGIVTGGDVWGEGDQGCWAYPFPKCAHHVENSGYESCGRFTRRRQLMEGAAAISSFEYSQNSEGGSLLEERPIGRLNERDGDSGYYKTPACKATCDDPELSFASQHRWASDAYQLRSVESIKRDMIEHGATAFGYAVYEDFLTYRSGIYHHVTGSLVGYHAVKCVGWGHDEASNLDYWVCLNSWNESWGEGGYFKIKMGECGFENMVTAGVVE